MKKLQTFARIIFIILFSLACTKEKRIEHSLYKKGGKWTIDKFTAQNVAQGYIFSSYAFFNVGEMSFSENGDFEWNQSVNGVSQNITGKWSNNENTLFIQADTANYEFRIKNKKSNEMTLINEDTLGIYLFIVDKARTTLDLTRKK